MSILTKNKIIELVKNNKISYSPSHDIFQLKEHAVDLRVGFTFLVPKVWHLTPKGRESLNFTDFDKSNAEYFDVIELEEGQYFDLLPQEFIIASTLESIKVPNDLVAVLYPRSSTNRRGLSLDLAGIINAGFEGQLTIPIRNNTKSQVVRLYPGERVCQIVFEELSEPIATEKSKYHKGDIIDGLKHDNKKEAKLILAGEIKKLKGENRIN